MSELYKFFYLCPKIYISILHFAIRVIEMELKIKQEETEYQGAYALYRLLTKDASISALLMESRTINLAYGKKSIIAENLALKISGKNEAFCIEALTEQGLNLLGQFSRKDFPFADSYEKRGNKIKGTYSRKFNPNLNEGQRIRDSNANKFLRAILQKFQSGNDFAGLYGAFAYDFARNFENIGNIHDKEPGDDFALFFPTSIYVFDDIRQIGARYAIQVDGRAAPFKSRQLHLNSKPLPRYESMTEKEYIEKVKSVISDIENGRFMQCVLSRAISVPLKENPIESYGRLRETNPSPYCFFFNFGNGEFLYGSSPEIHAVVDNGEMTIRPLAGTMRRSLNPLEDAMLRIKLQTDRKELSEHSMLVDLARNEVYRLCSHDSVRVTDMFTIEQYPNLYHLASGVTGTLTAGMDSIDVLLTTIPAGTLSGAPKLEAMKAIEELENTRRGFYGGAVGYLSFNGNCNTGITIRSIDVEGGFSRVQAGSGIVAGSIPKNEAREVMLKLEKPLKILEAD